MTAHQPPTPKSQARAETLQRLEAERRRKKRRMILLQVGIGALLIAIVVGVTVVLLNRDDEDAASGGSDATDTSSSDASYPPIGDLVTEDNGFVVGEPDAKVTVQLVEDFQCPVCQQFEAAAGDMLAGYAASGDVTLEYRGIAFLDRASSTRYSSRALNASACVMPNGQEVWTEFHKQMYLQQPAEGGAGLTTDEIVAIAEAAGADSDGLEQCVADEPYADWTQTATNAAFDDGVQGTPTVFVDGEPLASFDPSAVQAAIEEALAS